MPPGPWSCACSIGQCSSQSSCQALPFLPAQASPEVAGSPTIWLNPPLCSWALLRVSDPTRGASEARGAKETHVTGFGLCKVPEVYHCPFSPFL